jgi:hypothetical protein
MRAERDPMCSRVANGTRARRPASRDGVGALPMGLRANRKKEVSQTIFLPTTQIGEPGKRASFHPVKTRGDCAKHVPAPSSSWPDPSN